MADAKQDDSKPVNPVKDGGDHDRVTMLSLNADGSPDQHNPEIIGDKEAAKAATAEQFKQQAVAAIDAANQVVPEEDTSDASIDPVKAEHDKAAEAAEKRASQVVDDLSK